jgi:hypothetical protein
MPRKEIKPINVLVIEDNPADVFLMREALKVCPLPIHLTSVELGSQALKLIQD